MSDSLSTVGGETLLVVDDDRVTRLTISRVLKKAGYEVVETGNGVEALEAVAHSHPSLVLMDVLMPEMDGYTACHELRFRYDHQSLPILMLTALSDPQSIDKAFDSGATDFITKPINWTLLTKRVRYSLRARAMSIDLQRNQERLSQAQRIARLGSWELDVQTGVMQCSDELYWLLGIDPSEAIVSLQQFIELVHEDDRSAVEQVIEQARGVHGAYRVEYRLRCAGDKEITVHQQSQMVSEKGSARLRLLSTIQDISEHKAAEKLIEYQAFYDSLTDLPNRRLFTDQLSHAISLANQQGTQAALVFIGMDRLKMVNDTMGHTAGDELLREMANRLKGKVEDGVSIARFGADVFGVMLEGLEPETDVASYASLLLQQLAEPVSIQGQELFTTASAGIALYPHDGIDTETLLKAADSAMSRAKEEGGQQIQYFTAGMNARAQQRLQIEGGLRKALEREEFQLFYQPQIDTRTRQIVSMEALIRWNHPEKGIISPLEFITVAEESGLILPIGEWVLRKACHDAQRWNEQFGMNLRVGVNLSGRQFAQHDLLGLVADVLQESGLPRDNLELEVTESVAMDDIDACIDTLQHFKEMGVRVSIDDFGTGYSSLSYLQQMPLHTLKIDRAFVKDIKGNGENGEIARAIIAMAHSLGMAVVAEGVESEEQLQYLNEQGCDIIQGFYISKPLPADAFEKQFLSITH